MAAKRCPNCGAALREHVTQAEPDPMLVLTAGKRKLRSACVKCGLPVKLMPKWRKMKEYIESWEKCGYKMARKALGRKR